VSLYIAVNSSLYEYIQLSIRTDSDAGHSRYDDADSEMTVIIAIGIGIGVAAAVVG